MSNMASFEIVSSDLTIEQPESYLHSNFTVIPEYTGPIIHDFNSKSSLFSDVGNEELSLQLGELLDENNILKERLQRNNKMMNEQLEKILVLEKLVTEANDKHRTMLTDADNDNHKLQIEKEELCKKVEELQYTLTEVESSKVSLCDKLQELEKAILEKTAEVQNLNEQLIKQQKIQDELVSDLQCMSSQLSNLQLTIKQLEKSCSDLLNADENGYVLVQPVNNYKDCDIKDSVKLWEEKQEKVQNLKKAFNQLENNIMLKLELYEANKELSSTCAIMEESKNRWSTILLELESYKNQLEEIQNSDTDLNAGLKANLRRFENLLTEEKLRNEFLNNAVTDAKENSKELAEENEKLKKLLDENKVELEKFNDEIGNATESTAQEHLVQVDNLTAKLLTVEEELEAAKEEASSLKQHLAAQAEFKEQFEIQQVLKAQVELYKCDYEIEKSARESSQQEVEKLTQRISSLENQLEEWKSKAESRGSKLRMSKGHRRRYSNEAKLEKGMAVSTSAEPLEMSCPCCTLTFTSLESLESHLRSCLDNA